MRIVVGYTDTSAGRDALALGIRLARSCNAELVIALVLINEERPSLTPSSAGYQRLLEQRADEWLATAAARVPDTIPTQTHWLLAGSTAEGLIQAAADADASLIVVGGSEGGVRGRFQVGSVTSALLHSSPIPVALAPRGLRSLELGPVARLTVAIGQRAGADELVDTAIALATRTHAQLRFISLVALDVPKSARADATDAAVEHAEALLAHAQEHLPEGVASEALVASGKSIEAAVKSTVWQPSEVVLVGSSRLAPAGRIFLGATAAKMLHALPVPMIVVPRDNAVAFER